MAKPKVAILGLGIMGSGMARRLLSQSFPLTVYNRDRDKCAPFTSEGALAAETPREAASRSQIVISMVANDEASRDIWLGDNGALAGAATGSLLIESSTLSSEWIHELAAKAAARNCLFLDAPVTGTKPHAASGEELVHRLALFDQFGQNGSESVKFLVGGCAIHFGDEFIELGILIFPV